MRKHHFKRILALVLILLMAASGALANAEGGSGPEEGGGLRELILTDASVLKVRDAGEIRAALEEASQSGGFGLGAGEFDFIANAVQVIGGIQVCEEHGQHSRLECGHFSCEPSEMGVNHDTKIIEKDGSTTFLCRMEDQDRQNPLPGEADDAQLAEILISKIPLDGTGAGTPQDEADDALFVGCADAEYLSGIIVAGGGDSLSCVQYMETRSAALVNYNPERALLYASGNFWYSGMDGDVRLLFAWNLSEKSFLEALPGIFSRVSAPRRLWKFAENFDFEVQSGQAYSVYNELVQSRLKASVGDKFKLELKNVKLPLEEDWKFWSMMEDFMQASGKEAG